MAIFNWRNIYAVGHETIDNQHKEIIALFNKLYENFTDQKCDIYESALEDLISYTTCHFATEEQYMSERRYEGAEHHIQEHMTFSEKLAELKKTPITDRNESCKELIYYLGYWVLNHETEEDKKLVQELGNHQAAA